MLRAVEHVRVPVRKFETELSSGRPWMLRHSDKTRVIQKAKQCHAAAALCDTNTRPQRKIRASRAC